MRYIITPLVGIEWDNGRISLGMSKDNVISILGEPFSIWDNSVYYFGNELRFDFNSDNELDFIEFLGGIEGKLKPVIFEIEAFSVLADELLTVLTNKNDGSVIDNENGYSYAFPEIGIGIYRESIPDDIDEMIKAAEEAGEPLNKEDYNYEMSKAIHWASIGFGSKDYYR